MKLLKLIAPISILLASLSGFASDDNVKVNVIERSERNVLRDSSEHNRMKVSNTILAQLVGAGPTVGSQKGLIFGHYFDSDKLVQIEATGGEDSWSYSNSYKTKGNTVGVFYKQHSGNSFYFKTGVDYSTLDYSYLYVSGISGSGYSDGYSFKGNKISASFSIGNQWQWENFTLGCDWIGWSVPLIYNSSDEQTYGGNSWTDEDLRRSKETYLKNGYPLALHFYMGASF